MNSIAAEQSSQDAILIVFNTAYFRYARALFESIKANYPDHPDLLVYYEGDNPEVLSYLEAQRSFVPVSLSRYRREFGGLPAGPIGHPIVYARFYAFAEDFAHYRNIVYLDADTVVLKPLDHLLAMDGFVVGHNFRRSASHLNEPFGVFQPTPCESQTLCTLLAEDGLPVDPLRLPMVQAGVMKIPRSFRMRNAVAEMHEIGLRYGPYLRLADQSLVSIWCRLNGIEPQYLSALSFRSRDLESLEEISRAYIVHFDKYKPDSIEFANWPALEDFAPNQPVIDALTHMFYRYADYLAPVKDTQAHLSTVS